MKKLIIVIFIVVCLSGLGLAFQETKTEKPQEETKTAKTACLKEIGGYWYAYWNFNGSYDLIREKAVLFKEEFTKQGLTATGPYFVTFYNSPKIYQGDDLKWAISVPIDKDAVVKDPIKKRYLTPVKAAYIEHKDDPSKIWDSFYKVEDFMEANDYDTDWPAYEIYNRNPTSIEVIHPVKKMEKKNKEEEKKEEKNKEEKK